jgi:hypothetical protein
MKTGETGEEQSEEHANVFFKIKETVTNNSSCPAKQSNVHATVIFYSNSLNISEDFVPNFDDKRTGCCITTTHRLTLTFSPRSFLLKITRPPSRTTLLFSVSPIEDKIESPPFLHN